MRYLPKSQKESSEFSSNRPLPAEVRTEAEDAYLRQSAPARCSAPSQRSEAVGGGMLHVAKESRGPAAPTQPTVSRLPYAYDWSGRGV